MFLFRLESEAENSELKNKLLWQLNSVNQLDNSREKKVITESWQCTACRERHKSKQIIMLANLAWREHSHSLLTPNLSSSWTLSTAARHIKQLLSIPHRISLSSPLSLAWKMWRCASSSHSSIFLLCCKDAQNAGGVQLYFFIPYLPKIERMNKLCSAPTLPVQ